MDSADQSRQGFIPAPALRMVMRHISENVASQADFIVSTGDLVEPATDAAYQVALDLWGLAPSTALPGPLGLNTEGLQNFPLYFLPGNHDDRLMLARYFFPSLEPPALHNSIILHKGVQLVFMDWGPSIKAFLFPETREFLAQALEADFPSLIICHHHVKPVGSRWLDDFLADNLKEFWDIVTAPDVKSKVLGIVCGHAHITYEAEQFGLPILGLRSTSFPFARVDDPVLVRSDPQYRLITIHDSALSSRVFTVPLPKPEVP